MTELGFKIEFDRRRFTQAAIRRLLGHLRHLMESIAANPEMSVRDLQLTCDAERRQLIGELNIPEEASASDRLPLDGGATLCGLFDAAVASRPEAIALKCDERSLTYTELNTTANRLARRLVECGIKPDSIVGLCLDRSSDLVAAILAILKAGGAYLPIDLAYPEERVAFMLEDSQAPVR